MNKHLTECRAISAKLQRSWLARKKIPIKVQPARAAQPSKAARGLHPRKSLLNNAMLSSRQPPFDPNWEQQRFLKGGSWNLLETHRRLSLTVTLYHFLYGVFIFIHSLILRLLSHFLAELL